MPLDPAVVGLNQTAGRGVSHLDDDRDGDADLLIATTRRGFERYENVGDGGNALQLTLGSSGRPTLGTEVTVSANGTTKWQVHKARTDFRSQDSGTLHFGTGPDATATVTVTWPDGTTDRYTDVATGQRLVLTRDGIRDRYPFDS